MTSYYEDIICYITDYINDNLSKHTSFRVYPFEFQNYNFKTNSFEPIFIGIDDINSFNRINQTKSLYVNYKLDESSHSNEEFIALYYNDALRAPFECFEFIEIDTYDKIISFKLNVEATEEIMKVAINGNLRRENNIKKEPEIPQININLYLL